MDSSVAVDAKPSMESSWEERRREIALATWRQAAFLDDLRNGIDLRKVLHCLEEEMVATTDDAGFIEVSDRLLAIGVIDRLRLLGYAVTAGGHKENMTTVSWSRETSIALSDLVAGRIDWSNARLGSPPME